MRKNYDLLVLNEKRSIDGSLECYNCNERYFPSAGQGVDWIPSYLNRDGKDFCDAACLLAFAQSMISNELFEDFHHTLNAAVGHQVPLLGSRWLLAKKGGSLSVEQYKQGYPNFEPIVPNAPSKREKIESDEAMDVEEF